MSGMSLTSCIRDHRPCPPTWFIGFWFKRIAL